MRMSDELKEIKNFQKKAKQFAESYLSQIKMYPFLFETEGDEKEDSKPTEIEAQKAPSKKKINAAIEAFVKFKEEKPEATDAQIDAYRHALSVRSGVPIHLIQEPKKIETRQLSPEERREEDKKAKANREEFAAKQKADLEARRAHKEKQSQRKLMPAEEEGAGSKEIRSPSLTGPQIKKQPPFAPPENEEKWTKIPAGMSAEKRGGNKDRIEAIAKEKAAKRKADIQAFLKKKPDASEEEVANYLSAMKDIHGNEESNRKLNVPTSHEIAQAKMKRKIHPDSVHRRKLGTSIHERTVETKLRPFIKNILNKYTMLKKSYAPLDSEAQNLIRLVEKEWNIPPFNPESPEAQQAFHQSTTDLVNKPTSVIPAGFLQSSLRSYPLKGAEELAAQIGQAGASKPDPEEFQKLLAQKGQMKPREYQKALNALTLSNQDVMATNLVSYLDKLPIKALLGLLDYYKNHSSEIAASERAYKTPEFVAGKGGFEGVTTGNLGKEESFIDDAVDIHDTDELDREIARKELIPDAYGDTENVEDAFDVPSVLKHADSKEVKDLDPKFFGALKSKNVLDGYFDKFEELVSASDENVSNEQKMAMASRFLEKIFSDDGMKRLTLKGVARLAAANELKKQIEEFFTERNFTKRPPEQRRELWKKALGLFNANEFQKLANEKEATVNKAFDSLKHRTKDGRFALKSPNGVKWSNEAEKEAANVIYDKLAPNQLIRLAPEGQKMIDQFMLGKADQVHRQIKNIVDSVAKRHVAGLHKAELERKLGGEKVETPQEAAAREETRKNEKMADRESLGATAQRSLRIQKWKREHPKATPQELQSAIKDIDLDFNKTEIGDTKEKLGAKEQLRLKINNWLAQHPTAEKHQKEDAIRKIKLDFRKKHTAPFNKPTSAIERTKRELPHPLAIQGVNPRFAPHVPELRDADLELRNAISSFRKSNPSATPEMISHFAQVIKQQRAEQAKKKADTKTKQESLKNKIYLNLFLEGKKITFENIKKYLISSVKRGDVSEDTLREVLFDINGDIVSTAREDNWEEASKKKRKRATGA